MIYTTVILHDLYDAKIRVINFQIINPELKNMFNLDDDRNHVVVKTHRMSSSCQIGS